MKDKIDWLLIEKTTRMALRMARDKQIDPIVALKSISDVFGDMTGRGYEIEESDYWKLLKG